MKKLLYSRQLFFVYMVALNFVRLLWPNKVQQMIVNYWPKKLGRIMKIRVSHLVGFPYTIHQETRGQCALTPFYLWSILPRGQNESVYIK